jgi:hypothetical protein
VVKIKKGERNVRPRQSDEKGNYRIRCKSPVPLFKKIFGIVEIAGQIAEMGVFIVNIAKIELTHFILFIRIVVDISFIDIAQDFVSIKLLVKNHPYHLHPRIENTLVFSIGFISVADLPALFASKI